MTVAYPMDETRSSFIEKSRAVYEFSLETDRHPPSIHLFGDKWFINRFFIKQSETRRGISILRQWKPDFNGSRKPVFHPTIGREAETMTLLSRCPSNFSLRVFGFRPR